MTAFARAYFNPKTTQDKLYALLANPVARCLALAADERHEFRGQLTDFVRRYALLAQVLPFKEVDLEKLHVYA